MYFVFISLMQLYFSFFISSKCISSCVCDNYVHEEDGPRGKYTCKNNCDCGGTRMCSKYGWCNFCSDLHTCPSDTSYIDNCSSYMQNNPNKCANCKNSMVLTIGKTACVKPILNCLEYSDDQKCYQCGNGTVLNADNLLCIYPYIVKNCSSINETLCMNAIPNCLVQTNDNLCESCIFGTNLTTDELSCKETNLTMDQYSHTIFSKLHMTFPQSSSNLSIALLKSSHLINIINEFSTNYDIFLSNSNITLSPSNITQNNLILPVIGTFYKDNKTLSIILDFSKIKTDYYYISVNIGFMKITRILQENSAQQLPDFFLIDFMPKLYFFVGTYDEINQYLGNNHTESNDFNVKLFAILFSVFGFLTIFLAFCVCIVIKRKKIKKMKEMKIKFASIEKDLNFIEKNISPVEIAISKDKNYNPDEEAARNHDRAKAFGLTSSIIQNIDNRNQV